MYLIKYREPFKTSLSGNNLTEKIKDIKPTSQKRDIKTNPFGTLILIWLTTTQTKKKRSAKLTKISNKEIETDDDPKG